MDYLLLNRQGWDIKSFSPALFPIVLSFLKGLVNVNLIHEVFNTRRLHILIIVK